MEILLELSRYWGHLQTAPPIASRCWCQVLSLQQASLLARQAGLYDLSLSSLPINFKNQYLIAQNRIVIRIEIICNNLPQVFKELYAELERDEK